MICAFLCHTLTGASCKPGLPNVATTTRRTSVPGARRRSASQCPAAQSVEPGLCEVAGQKGAAESSLVLSSCGFLAFLVLIGLSLNWNVHLRLIFIRPFKHPPLSPILHRVNRICIIEAKINKSNYKTWIKCCIISCTRFSIVRYGFICWFYVVLFATLCFMLMDRYTL